MEFKKSIEWSPAYDKRAQGYGIHGVEMRWLLQGTAGVIQFLVFTNWQLPNVTREFEDKFCSYPYNSPRLFAPMAADLGYHSLVPLYEGQSLMNEKCPYLDGQPCYYDGSSCNAEGVFALLVEKGEDAVWTRLTEEYELRFGTRDAQGESAIVGTQSNA